MKKYSLPFITCQKKGSKLLAKYEWFCTSITAFKPRHEASHFTTGGKHFPWGAFLNMKQNTWLASGYVKRKENQNSRVYSRWVIFNSLFSSYFSSSALGYRAVVPQVEEKVTSSLSQRHWSPVRAYVMSCPSFLGPKHAKYFLKSIRGE